MSEELKKNCNNCIEKCYLYFEYLIEYIDCTNNVYCDDFKPKEQSKKKKIYQMFEVLEVEHQDIIKGNMETVKKYIPIGKEIELEL